MLELLVVVAEDQMAKTLADGALDGRDLGQGLLTRGGASADAQRDGGVGRGDADFRHVVAPGQVEQLGLDFRFASAERVDLAVHQHAAG